MEHEKIGPAESPARPNQRKLDESAHKGNGSNGSSSPEACDQYALIASEYKDASLTDTAKFSYFNGGITNVRDARQCSWKELGEGLRRQQRCLKEKAGYFTRGVIPVKEGKTRCNDALECGYVLCIDGDDCASPPDGVHKALKKLGLNHYVYTTASYTFATPKYRAMVQ